MKKVLSLVMSALLIIGSLVSAVMFTAVAAELPAESVIGAAVFFESGGVANPASNHFCETSLTVGDSVAATVTEGEQATASVKYDKESGAYRFIGWYKDDTLISNAESYTFVAAAGEKYTPRFQSNNVLYQSASFEGDAAGTDKNVLDVTKYPENGLWGSNKNAGYYGATIDGTVYDGTGKAYIQTASGAVEVRNALPVTVTDEFAHSGSQSLKLQFSYRTASLGIPVQKNTDYTLSYYWLAQADTMFKTTGISNTLNISNANAATAGDGATLKDSLSNLMYKICTSYTSITTASDGETWQKVTLSFNSGNFETMYLLLAPNAGEVVYIDDLVCMNTAENQIPVKFVNSKDEVLSADNEYAKAVVEDQFDGTTKASVTFDTNSVYRFKGWYDGTELVSDKPEFTYSTSQHSSLTPVIVTNNVLLDAASFESYKQAETNIMVTRGPSGTFRYDKPEIELYTAEAPTADKWGIWTDFSAPSQEAGGSWCGENYLFVRGTNGVVNQKYMDGDQTPTAEVTPHTGNSMVQLGAHSRSAIRRLDGLTPNTDYILSFYLWTPDSENYIKSATVATNYTGLKTSNATPVSGSDCKVLGKISIACDQIQNWKQVTVAFNSEANTYAYLHLAQQSKSTSDVSDSFIDDLVCYADVNISDIGVEFEDSNGQTVTEPNVYAKSEYSVNDQNEVTATAVWDNKSAVYSFKGWYKNGTLMSTDTTIHFPATDMKAYVLRFVTKNILHDTASFEGYKVGRSLLVSGIDTLPQNGLWGYCRNAGYDGPSSDTNVTVLDQTGLQSKLPDASVPTGDKALLLGMNFRAAFYGFTVQPNTDYYISYKWLTKSSKKANDLYYGVANTYISKNHNILNPASQNSVNPDILVSYSSNAFSDGYTWQTHSMRFNSGENTQLYLAIAGPSDGLISGAVDVILDDLTCMPIQPTTLKVNDMKSCASVVPVDCEFNNLFVGQNVAFSIVDNRDTEPVVKLNDQVLLPDTNGQYHFTAAATQNLSVRFNGDENLNDHDKDFAGNDLSAYNENVYLTDIWSGDTVYHESALFTTGRETVKLLYPVDKVVSLRSYDLKTNYVEHVDYEITSDGLIKILPGSRIPVYSGALTTTTQPTANAFPVTGKTGEWLSFIGDTAYPQYAVAVTYTHAETFADGYQPAAPASQTNKMAKTISKLKAGEDVNIVVYGDSISCGWSSSGLNSTNVIYDTSNTEGNFKSYIINVAPYAPTWIDMFISRLAAQYPDAKIHVKNLALGGTGSQWGANNIAARLALWKDANNNVVTPDLMLVGFGVNDSPSTTADQFKNNSQNIISNARTASANSDMEFLFYSPMLPNQNAVTWEQSILLGYESKLAEIAAADNRVGLVKLTSIFASIVDSKEAVDYLNTNVNHGNDFTARIYATGLLAAFSETAPEFKPGDVNGDGLTNLGDVVTLARVKAGWSDEHYVTAALDTNGDGQFNLQDVTYLAQNLAGWADRMLSEVPYTGAVQ